MRRHSRFFFVSRPPKWKKKKRSSEREGKNWIRGSESSNSVLKLNRTNKESLWLKRMQFRNRDTSNKDGPGGAPRSRRFRNFFFGFTCFFLLFHFKRWVVKPFRIEIFKLTFCPQIRSQSCQIDVQYLRLVVDCNVNTLPNVRIPN